MSVTSKFYSKGFILAGVMNLSVLVFSKFFTNPVLAETDPDVASNFGVLMIVIWGLAYMAVSKQYHHVKWLVGVFAVEKFIYGFVWTKWMLNNDVSAVFAKDLMAGTFFSIYGINDWIFCIFFFIVFVKLINSGLKKGNA